MKAVTGLFVFVIIAVIGVHGFFSVKYGTMNPCKAAVERIKMDKKSGGLLDKAVGELIGLGQEIVGSDRLAAELEMEKGTPTCYQIALTGESE